MTHHRLLRRLPTVALIGLAVAALLFGCDTQDEPVFDNPLDPNAPGSEDPFGLTALYDDGQVTLEWTVPAVAGIDSIVVESVVNSQPVDLAKLGRDAESFIDLEPRGNTENRYRLRAVDASGREAQTSHVVAATVFVPPVIDIPSATVNSQSGGLKILGARHDIGVQAVFGDVVQMDTLRDFSTTEPVEVVDGVGMYPEFRLLKPRLNGAALPSRMLYCRVGLVTGDDDEITWTAKDSVNVQMDLQRGISRLGGGSTLAEPRVTVALTSTGIGVDSVRFATSKTDLETAPWLPSAGTYEDVAVRDTPGDQKLYAEFVSGFGDRMLASAPLSLSGDDLSTAGFNLVLPESGIVEGRRLGLEPSAVATEMLFSTYLDFRDAEWQAYSVSLGFTLRDEPGPQTIYARFRNHWFISGIKSQVVQLSASTLDVAFTQPLDGDPVRGGGTIDLSGTVSALPDTFTVTDVSVNTGDGWQSLGSSAAWTTTWTAEQYAADTPWPLGVRATEQHDETGEVLQGTEWIEVTISQLTLTITDPDVGEEIFSGEPYVIKGTATRDLTGEPLAGIRVTVAGATLFTTEDLTGWSVVWSPDPVTESTPVTVEAMVFAGSDSLATSVDAVLLPPEPEEDEKKSRKLRRGSR